jgi:endonuclease/exonuclease/phosphatase family metal-dependent hydrolase
MIGRVEVRALSWNLFHGRDFPPNPAVRTCRSRLTRRPERDATHIQVNRDLHEECASLLAGWEWDIALLQECPPRWSGGLTAACSADSHRVLTARNWFLPITSLIASFNPDLIASWEGGSNLTLVRGTEIVERRSLVVRRLPERRVMAFTRLASGLCVANLHASGPDRLAEPEVSAAARQAIEWATGARLVFGGDLNLRPEDSSIFEHLERELGMRPPLPGSIDHLLARGLRVAEPPRAMAPEEREVRDDGLAIRLSDHAPLAATFID